MFANESLRPPAVLTVFAVALIVCVIGAAVPIYVLVVGDSPARLMALPTVILLAFLLVFSRKFLFLLIILFRASGDILFAETKISIAGYAIGVGGLINGFVLLIAVLLVMEKPRLLPKRLVITMWAPFLLIALYGVTSAPVKIDAIKLYLSQLSYFAIFVSAFYFVRTAKDFRSCVVIVLWSSLLPAAYALVDIALNAMGGGLGGFRLQSTFAHPNQFAFYLALVLLLALYMLKSSSFAMSSGKRLGLTVYMAFLVALLLLTQTRSAWIACFAVFGGYALFFERRYVVYLILIPILGLLIPSLRERVFDLGQGNEYGLYVTLNAFAWRRMMWEAGLKWMQPEHYFFGYGLGAFQYYSTTFSPLAGHAVNFGAHSTFVQWFFEMGVAGVAAYGWLFTRILWLLRWIRDIDKLGAYVSFSLIAAYLIVSFADNMPAYLAFNWYFWFIVGAATSVVLVAPRSVPEARNGADAKTA